MADTKGEEKADKMATRDTFFIGADRKQWIKERSEKLGLGKSEYIRRLIDEDRKKAAKEG